MDVIISAWNWICEYPEATIAIILAACETVTRLRKTKDSAGFIKRIGAGVDIILDIIRMPNRLK